MNEFVPLGNTTVCVSDDEYVNAYQSGYLTYKLDYSKKTLSELDIYHVLMNVATSVRHSARYSAGFVTGWMAGFFEKTKLAPLPVPTVKDCGAGLAARLGEEE